MASRFWRPTNEGPSDVLTLVGCVASEKYLYVIMEGSGPPPKDVLRDGGEMLWTRVTTESGLELHAYGGDGGTSSTHGRRFFANLDAPPEPSEMLTVTLLREDGSVMWEVNAAPVA